MKNVALFTAFVVFSSTSAFANNDCTVEVIDVKAAQAKEAIQLIGQEDPDRMLFVVSEFQQNLSIAQASAELAPVCESYDAVINAVEG